MYFRVHDNILIDKWHLFPVILQELLQHRGGPSRTTELDSLCRIHQLDRQDMIQVVHDLKQFRRRIRPHTHMILLSITRHDRIAARRIAIHLILAYHTGSRILRDHETGVQAGISDQELRQSPQTHDQLSDTTFRYIS